MRDFVTSAAEAVGRTFKFRTIEGYGGVPIHMGEAGAPDAPPVILIHGLAASSLMWVHQLTSDLTNHARVIIYDLRGHGASAKPWTPDAYARPHTTAGDLRAVAAAAGVNKFTAVAWSYGGHVLMDYIRSFGIDGLEKINLVGTLATLVARPTAGATNPEQMKAAQARSVSDNPFEVIQANFGQADFVTHKNVSAEVQALVETAANQLPTYARKAMTTGLLQNADLLDSITCPVLLSVGTDDFTVPKVSVEALMAKLSAGRLSEYAGCGHAPFLEEPVRFNAELLAFVTNKA